MTVYVDKASLLWKGKCRHHLTADTLAELHEFASKIGVKPCWYHKGSKHPHYDITDEQREAALAAGAKAASSRTVLKVARLIVTGRDFRPRN